MSSFRFNRLITGLIVLASPVIVPVLAFLDAAEKTFRTSVDTFVHDISPAARYAFVEPTVAAKNSIVDWAKLAPFIFALVSAYLVAGLKDLGRKVSAFYFAHAAYRLSALVAVPAVLLMVAVRVLEGEDIREIGGDFRYDLDGIFTALKTGSY